MSRLESILEQLEVSPGPLRRDPAGREWLPEDARALVESSAECRDALARFVDEELELWDAMSPTATPVDPFFTARVVESLPMPRAGTALSPRRRAMVLGAFHVLAGLSAYVVLTMVPESTARWASQAHDVLSWGTTDGGLLAMATGFGAALLVAVFASRIHTPA